MLCLYPVPVQCFLRALAPSLGISLKEFGLIILCECILSSTRCCRCCLHQSSRMRERGEELLTAEDQPLPNRGPLRSAAVPPWFAFSRHIPSHTLTLATFPQCVSSPLPNFPVLALTKWTANRRVCARQCYLAAGTGAVSPACRATP